MALQCKPTIDQVREWHCEKMCLKAKIQQNAILLSEAHHANKKVTMCQQAKGCTKNLNGVFLTILSLYFEAILRNSS